MSGKLEVYCNQKGIIKTGINLHIDGQIHHLKPQEEPYIFELAAGNHKLKFKDPSGIAKKIGGGIVGATTTVTSATIGLAAGMVSGRASDMWQGTSGSASAGRRIGSNISNRVFGQSGSLKGEYDLTIHDNEVIRLMCTKDKNAGISVGII